MAEVLSRKLLVVHFQVKTTSHLIPFPTLIMASSRLHSLSVQIHSIWPFLYLLKYTKAVGPNVIYISLVIRFTTYSLADCIMDTFPIPSMRRIHLLLNTLFET